MMNIIAFISNGWTYEIGKFEKVSLENGLNHCNVEPKCLGFVYSSEHCGLLDKNTYFYQIRYHRTSDYYILASILEQVVQQSMDDEFTCIEGA